jgi:diguanylate cyclase (GGDEF)-like protein
MFWNELSISAVRNEAGVLTHFVGIQKDVTSRFVPDQHWPPSNQDLHALNPQLYSLAHTDLVAGISNRRHFDDRLSQMLQAAQRTHSLISILVVNLDQFKLFNEKYGLQAGDACLHLVGERIVKSFSRASDCVARYEGDEFAVVSMGDSREGMQLHVSRLRDQIRALNIPHSNTPDGVITICVGGITLIPQRDATAASLLQQAAASLHIAKKYGCDCEQLA